MNSSFFLKLVIKSMGLLTLALLHSACMGPEEIPKPENLINEDTYIDLLVDVQHVITYRNAYPDSVNAGSLAQEVYLKYGVTEEQFLASHTYYQKQVKQQIERINTALNKIKTEEQILHNRIDSARKENARLDSIARADSILPSPTPKIKPRPQQ